MSEAVKVERHGAVAVLRLDDPRAMNALSPAVKAGMEANVPKLVGDGAVRAIMLTGTGKTFCAGGDIRAMKDPEGRKAPAVRARMQVTHAWARALLDCDKPVIAAVNGAAVGAALRSRCSPTSSLPAETPTS
jgi:2-(1,2-epoxy-1,2-dihydrophenyl)acetyl-CoA isomerase